MPNAATYIVALALFLVLAAARSHAAEPCLRVGTSGDYAPFSSDAAGDGLEGFDLDLVRRFARDAHRCIEIVRFRWPELREALAADRFDLAASGITVRPERLLVGRYTRPYAITGAVILIRREHRNRVRALDDLNRAGVRIVVNAGGHLEAVTRATFPAAHVETVADNRALPRWVESGRADALVTDGLEANHFVERVPSLTALPRFTRDRKAILVARSQPNLHARIDAWLRRREEDGWMNRRRRRWLGEETEMSPNAALAETIVSLVEQRLGLMPWVGDAKRRAGMEIEDERQEELVLARTRAAAAGLDLDPEAAVDLFETLIEAAKAVQRRAGVVEPEAELARLRAILGELSERLLLELHAGRSELRHAGHARMLRDRFALLNVPGLDSAERDAIAAAVRNILSGM